MSEINQARLKQIQIIQNFDTGYFYKLPQNSLINIISRFLDDKILSCPGVKNETIKKNCSSHSKNISFTGKNYSCTIKYQNPIPAQKKNIVKVFNFLLIKRNYEDTNNFVVEFKDFAQAGIWTDSKNTRCLKSILEQLQQLKITYKDNKNNIFEKNIFKFQVRRGKYEINFNQEIASLPCFYSLLPVHSFLLSFTAFNLLGMRVCVVSRQNSN